MTPIYTLQRGQLSGETIQTTEIKESLKYYNKSRGDFEAIKKLVSVSDQFDHSGVHYKVVFRTNRPITLESLGFWGPHKVEIGDYQVSIIISKLSSLFVARQKSVIVSRLNGVVAARKRQVFYVPLQNSVLVEAGNWIQIEFELNGPTTFRSEEMQFECDGEGGVHFSFSDSSLQMPFIKYKIV